MAEAFGQGVLKLSLLGQNQDEVRKAANMTLNKTDCMNFSLDD